MNTEKKKVSDAQKRAQKKYDEKTKTVSIKFSPKTMHVHDKLKKYTDETGKSVSAFIKELIVDFFENGNKTTLNSLPRKSEVPESVKPVPSNYLDKYIQYYCGFVDDEHIDTLNGLFGSAVTEILLDEFYSCLEADLDNIIENGGLQLEKWIDDIAEQFYEEEHLQEIAAKYKNEHDSKQCKYEDLKTLVQDMYDSVDPTMA